VDVVGPVARGRRLERRPQASWSDVRIRAPRSWLARGGS